MNNGLKSNSDLERQMLRHTLATLAYRGAKVVDDAPSDFGAFRASETTRCAVEILSHINDLLNWAHSIARGAQAWPNSDVLSWDGEVSRFFSGLKELDEYLASDASLAVPPEKLFQAPIADALTHVGQIALLRRLAGAPIRGENYFKADIVAGRVGARQSSERVEFD
jgi:hypothetical protein